MYNVNQNKSLALSTDEISQNATRDQDPKIKYWPKPISSKQDTLHLHTDQSLKEEKL